MDFINPENNCLSEQVSHPSKSIEACQRESDPPPESTFPLGTSEKAADTMDDFVVEPMDESLIETMVLLPFPLGQQQDLMLEAPLDTRAEINCSSLNESLGLEDLVEKEVAPCMEDSFPEVVSIRPEQPTSQDPPSHLPEYPPEPCSEQFHNLQGVNTEAAPEHLVPSENVLTFSVALTEDLPVDPVDPGEETVEYRVIPETSFPAFPEEVESEHQALAANAEDVPSVSLTSSLVEVGPQEAPGLSTEDASRISGLDSETWMSPLAWLEKGVNTSVMLQNLRQRLSFAAVLQDAAVGNTPLSTCSVGTSFTPPAPAEAGTKHSASETERLLLG